MYKYELVTLLEKVLMKSYQMKNGEHAFHCPFCNHHKKKLQVNLETQKWHCWVCNEGGYKIGILLRKMGAPKHIIKEVLQLLNDYISYETDQKETIHDVSLPKEYKPLYIKSEDPIYKNAIPIRSSGFSFGRCFLCHGDRYFPRKKISCAVPDGCHDATFSRR